ncbi:MAG: tetratricopeptide repeat protein, partial [Candidatus Cloacimonadota bacterium]|nr:tetratricopeptide repeat protein [Candidatus Cloacimonadota bacterium]
MKKLVLYIFMLVSVSLAADLNFAKELYEDELYEEAISEFRKIIDTKPTSDEAQTALFFIGDSFIQLEQYSQAETIFNRFIEAYPSYKKRDEVLYNLASSQYEQQKYEKALQNYERLIHEFPLSSHTKNSLVKNLQCYYFIGKYNQLILKSKEYEKNYPETKKVSDFLFWRAKAYLANNMQKEAKNTLSLIEENYPNSNARWQALGLRIVILEQEEGKDAAIESLSEALKQNIPRFYEEELRYKLVKLYLQQENYNLALHELKALIEKFNMSAKMPEYIADFTYTQLKLKKYADIIAEYQGNLKYFKNSKLQPQYGYYVGKAYYQMSNYQQAQELVSKYKALAKPKLKTDLSYLEAVIWEETNKLTNAIELYQQLLRQNAEKSQDILM